MPGCQTGFWGGLSALVGNGRRLKCRGVGGGSGKEKEKDPWGFYIKGTREPLFAPTSAKNIGL